MCALVAFTVMGCKDKADDKDKGDDSAKVQAALEGQLGKVIAVCKAGDLKAAAGLIARGDKFLDPADKASKTRAEVRCKEATKLADAGPYKAKGVSSKKGFDLLELESAGKAKVAVFKKIGDTYGLVDID